MKVPDYPSGGNAIYILTERWQIDKVLQMANGSKQRFDEIMDEIRDWLRMIYTFDRERITSYMKENDQECPEDDLEFWRMVNNTILHLPQSTEKFIQYAKDWLILNGFANDVKQYEREVENNEVEQIFLV